MALLTAQATAVIAPEVGWPEAARTGVRALAAVLLVMSVSDLLRLLAFPPHDAGRTSLVTGLTATHVAIAGAVLIAAALLRTPHRAVANLTGYALVAVPLLWLAQRRAGMVAARTAAIALALFAFFPTHLDVSDRERLTYAQSGSGFRWSTGWPTSAWVLRHEIQLSRPLTGNWSIVIQLAAPNPRPPRILARLNGQDAGAFVSSSNDEIALHLPPALIAGQMRLTFEFRPESSTTDLRLSAHRWVAGASLGSAASSFFDGQGWHTGTFDDAAGRTVPGVYSLELRPD